MSKAKLHDGSEMDMDIWVPAVTRTVIKHEETILYLSIGLVANILATTYLLFNLWSK